MTPTERAWRPFRRGLYVALLLAFVAPSAARAQICLPPTGVSATDGTNCSNVVITWTGGSHGDSFSVFRGTTVNSAEATLIGGTSLQTFTDSQALPGVVYFYWVKRVNASCPGGSTLGGGNTGFIGTPPAPTNVAASDETDCAAIHLTWTEAPTTLLYQVWRSLTPNVNAATLIAITDTTFLDDAATDPLLTYYYFVRGTRGSCVGPFQAAPEAGKRTRELLPDLVLIEETFDPPTAQTFADGHSELLFASRIANAGSAPFDFRHTRAYADGTVDFTQTYIDVCGSGNVKLRHLGRGPIPHAGDPATFSHFLRATLRERAAGDVPGNARAQVDLPARSVRDQEVYFPALPGAPASPQFVSSTASPHGLSVGWSYRTGIGGDHQRVQLHCVGNGDYFLELTVDPDDLVEELDETNNTIDIPISLSNLPSFDPLACPGYAIDAQLLAPDSLAAAAGAPSDTFTARAWVAGSSPAPGPPPQPDAAQIGYALVSDVLVENLLGSAGADPWTWGPATWMRQDGEADIWSGKVTVPTPGEYLVTFRFNDFDGLFILADQNGTFDDFQPNKTARLSVRATTGVGDAATTGVPLALEALSNALAGSTRFRVGLPEAADVTIALYDVRGRRLRTLARGPREAGAFVLDWDGRDESGRAAPPGIYFARLETSKGASLTAKFLTLRR
jgi:hypothetical protein